MEYPSPEEMARRRKETREWLIEQGETPGLEWYSSQELIDIANIDAKEFLVKFFANE